MSVLVSFALLAIGILIGAIAVYVVQLRKKRKQSAWISELIDYLEAASLGQAKLITITGEDEFSQLQDEICKTVTALNRLQKRALEEKESYARNLANIAHQIKTPLAALYIISDQIPLTSDHKREQIALSIKKQLDRMSLLQENLLLMAKLDAGTLHIERSPQDVFTLLNIATDGVADIAKDAGVGIAIASEDPVEVVVDEHWTCEALSNIIKNCIEHSPSGSVIEINYETNPLYIEVLITDSGNGFDKEELLHLFERFYVGHNQSRRSTGLGLSFSKELLELQNGTVQASNTPDGGACFNIRFYRH